MLSLSRILFMALLLCGSMQSFAQSATFYSDCNYRGSKVSLSPGRYSFSQTGLGARTLSSIRVPQGLKVVLYDAQEPGNGSKTRFTADVSCLPGEWNDRAGSVSIEYDNAAYGYNQNNNNNYDYNYNGGNNTYQSYNRTDHITFFTECYFTGRNSARGEGDFNQSQMGISNDNISSIDIPSGWSVTVYADKDFQGNSKTFTRSVNCMASDWNDKVSSFRIHKGGGYQHETEVTVFEDCNYSKRSAHFSPGLHNVRSLGIKNDAISSMRIPYGYRVTVYQDEDGRGPSREFRNDVSCLGSDWNDRITSIRVSNANGVYTDNRGYNSYDYHQNNGNYNYSYSGGGDRGATIYTDSWFRGSHRTFGPGRYNLNGEFDMSISSLRVDQGYTVYIYTEFDQRGRQQTLTSSNANLGIFNLNDKVRSFEVIRN